MGGGAIDTATRHHIIYVSLSLPPPSLVEDIARCQKTLMGGGLCSSCKGSGLRWYP